MNKKIIGNFFSLASVQMLNYILPLLTLPYLMNNLGAEKFGLVNFAQAIIQYFILFTDYGFNLIATKNIAKVVDDKKQVSKIVSNALVAKAILLLVSALILLGLIVIVPKFRSDALIYLLTFGMVIGSVLFPTFYFQGIEEMKNISILNISFKLFFTIAIFIFIHNPSDYLLVPVFNSLGYITIGLVSLLIMVKKYHFTFTKPSLTDVKAQMREGWEIFLSNVSTSLYTTGNVVILGLLTNNTIVGYFSAADKIIKACSSVVHPLIQAVYPHVSHTLEKSKDQAITLIKKLFVYASIVIGVGCLILLFGSDLLFPIVFGDKYNHSIQLIKIMSFLPLITVWANIYGVLTLINFGYQKILSRIYVLCGLGSIVSTIVLITLFNEIGAAINVILIESIATLSMYMVIRQKKIFIK
ncbi:flippase [Vagococcus sp. BWB3-3]|uniref:Flippase n=1 Tax=Vagococcus allomyrinae TaxID=2794353 RepID=A0A940PIS9_9ENTE|nr:flippase [Vagococcus allomyrinae]MBP1043673.1 flippase [Vagococcus allomyrinae]